MSDIVERLREWLRRETAALAGESYETEMVREAADEIERLRAIELEFAGEIERLRRQCADILRRNAELKRLDDQPRGG